MARKFKAKGFFGKMYFTDDIEDRGDVDYPPNRNPEPQPTQVVYRESTGLFPFLAGWFVGKHD